MLGISARKIRKVIDHAESGADDMLEAFVEGLSDDEQAALIAMLWIGEEKYGPDSWEDALNTAMTEADGDAAAVLSETEEVAEALENAISILNLDEDEDDEDEDDPLDMGEDEDDY